MTITIHRGTHQIGGCVTEYESEDWKLFVDYGEELQGGPKSGTLKVEGLTHGYLSKSALLITHYHGDHIGSVVDLPESLLLLAYFPAYRCKRNHQLGWFLGTNHRLRVPFVQFFR